MKSFEEIVEDLDRDGFGHYLAGFADGEGSFVIPQVKGAFTCRFQLRLRDDDAAILFEVAERTGIGNVRVEKTYDGGHPDRKVFRPTIIWVVRNKRDCAVLVRLFERFPLRAKKSRDFAIWKRAVTEWSTKRRVGGWETMIALREELSAGRRYVDGDEIIDASPAPVFEALRLIDGAAA